MLPTQKIHFTYLQQYDENHCVYLARLGRQSEKSRRNVTTRAQHRSIYFCKQLTAFFIVLSSTSFYFCLKFM